MTEEDEANLYHLRAVITADPSTVEKLHVWTEHSMTTGPWVKLHRYNNRAQENWMGHIPAVIDASAYKSFHLGTKAFCNAGRLLDAKNTIVLYFRGTDPCAPLWDFLLTTDCGISSVYVFVDMEYSKDVKTLGKGLFY